MIVPFKGRKLDITRPMRVYRNLNGKNWSLWQDGLVQAHADRLMLKDCTFRVYKAGWQRMVREGRRNVHAFVDGTWVPMPPERPRFFPARYNRNLGHFEIVGMPAVLRGAGYVLLHTAGMDVLP